MIFFQCDVVMSYAQAVKTGVGPALPNACPPLVFISDRRQFLCDLHNEKITYSAMC